jgi:sphingomyelin phosphodiesterase
VITFLHLSDIHLDRQYAEGSPSVCNLYLCCRSWYNGTAPAGHYGNYKCDLPLVTLDVVVESIASLDPQPDFIIYTGDNSPHDLWNETWVSQFEATNYLVSYLAEKLPHTPVYPALGNHESYPESEYIGTLPQYQELTKRMAEYWQRGATLPQSAVETIAEGGYYTLLISDGLRLVSFNSDYGYSLNLYTLLNGRNPHVARQQTWITDTLELAEKAGERVVMIAHIPPGDPGNTLHEYDEFYLNLTKRFHDTIVGHLFGHTHHDEFKLIQDQEGVYGTVLVSPSVTPRGRSNPSFRLFTMDPSSRLLLDYQQFHLNLTLANEQAGRGVQPKMELAYSTSDLYHLPDLSPSSWASLVERFSQYPDLVSEYRYNKYGQSSSHDRSCDAQCLRETICTISNVVNSERKKCIDG